MAAVMNGLKAEDAMHIKDEANDVGTPMSAISEDVEDEDTGELTIPKSDSDYPGVFLARVPKELWQGLVDSNTSMDEPIRIGTIKAWSKEGTVFPEVRTPTRCGDARLLTVDRCASSSTTTRLALK